MDLLRSSIEAVFFRFPVSSFAEHIIDPSRQSNILDYIIEIVVHQNPEYTFSEISLLGKMLDDSWLSDESFKISGNNYSQIQRLPLLLNIFAQATLSCNNVKFPKVQFNQLLRWRMLTMLLGEDLFTLPFLARLDLSRNLPRTDFSWSDILGHDNFRLNIVLNDVLSDTHSHINAAIDVFEFNWICLMNSPELIMLNSKKTDFMFAGANLEYDLVRRYSTINYNLSQWTYIAAAIRLMLWAKIENRSSELSPGLIKQILENPVLLNSSWSKIENEIQLNSISAANLDVDINSGGRLAFDYAIKATDINETSNHVPSSPYLILTGERMLIYRWFKGYYGNTDGYRDIASYIMLYLLIKSKIRREYIQTNELVGFRNFQIYQNRKNNFLTISDKIKKSKYGEIAYRYAIQSSLGSDRNDYVEARLTPEGISEFRKTNFRKSIFENGKPFEESILSQISIIAHLIKAADTENPDLSLYRHYNIRERYWKEIKIVVEEYLKNNPKSHPDITGIDAASNELLCRPEVFAPMFRYARHSGISRITYHAGEDFFDIVDGLRTIDEAIDYMGYSIGDRIGHGLALGTNPDSFYRSKHFILIIPRQLLLDNVVWMKYKAQECHIRFSAETELFIECNFNEIARELGYFSISQSMYEYYCSMKLRGDIIDEENSGISDHLTDDVRYSACSVEYHKKGNRATLESLHHHYEFDSQCRRLGSQPITVSVTDTYCKDISLLQEAMLTKIENMGIVIETNPSSNLKIGRFDRYDQHPITKFNSIIPSPDKHSIVVSINTDDKGVFSTSLENEFSLLAIALKKHKDSNGNRKYSEGQIEEYLKRLARYGNITRFSSDYKK